jgi:rhodanese-related sulfurtransferase
MQRRSSMSGAIAISPRDAQEKVRRGAVLLDVVGDAAWPALRETPAGALRLPPSEVRERSDRLPRDRAVVAFCT